MTVIFVRFQKLRARTFHVPVVEVFPSIVCFLLLPGNDGSIFYWPSRLPFVRVGVTVSLPVRSVAEIGSSCLRICKGAPQPAGVFHPRRPVNSYNEVVGVVDVFMFRRVEYRNETFVLERSAAWQLPIRWVLQIPSWRSKDMVREEVDRMMVLTIARGKEIEVVAQGGRFEVDLYVRLRG